MNPLKYFIIDMELWISVRINSSPSFYGGLKHQKASAKIPFEIYIYHIIYDNED